MQPVPRTHTPLQSHRHTGLGAQGVSGQKYKSKGAETSDLEVPWNVHPGKTHILTFLTAAKQMLLYHTELETAVEAEQK